MHHLPTRLIAAKDVCRRSPGAFGRRWQQYRILSTFWMECDGDEKRKTERDRAGWRDKLTRRKDLRSESREMQMRNWGRSAKHVSEIWSAKCSHYAELPSQSRWMIRQRLLLQCLVLKAMQVGTRNSSQCPLQSSFPFDALNGAQALRLAAAESSSPKRNNKNIENSILFVNFSHLISIIQLFCVFYFSIIKFYHLNF